MYILVLEIAYMVCVTKMVVCSWTLWSQTLEWFNPEPGKIFDDQYSYSSVWYRIIFLVLLCRHPHSSKCVIWSQIFINGLQPLVPQCVGYPIHCCSYLPFWPKLPHSREKQMLVYSLPSPSNGLASLTCELQHVCGFYSLSLKGEKRRKISYQTLVL